MAANARPDEPSALRSRTADRAGESGIFFDELRVFAEEGVAGAAEDRIEDGLGGKDVRACPRERFEASPGVRLAPGADAVRQDRDREPRLHGVDRRLEDADRR